MSFANCHLAMCVGELHKMKEETGDFTLTCQGKDIKAHSLILSTGSVLDSMDGEMNVKLSFSGLSFSRRH